MLNLDSAAALAGLDSSSYLSLIDSYSAQLDAGWRLAAGLPLPAGAERADLVLLAAVGDAALAADVARHCVLFRSRLPVVLWQDGALPAFVGPRTFVVVVAAGDDLTAPAALAAAAAVRHATVLAISDQGEPWNGLPVWQHARGATSRGLFPTQVALTLEVLHKLGCVPDAAPDIDEAVSMLDQQRERLTGASPLRRNPAKRMAGQLMERNTALFVVDELAPAGRRWASAIHQSARAWAECYPLVDADEVAAGALFPEAMIERYMVLFLRGADEVQSSQLRADQTRLLYMTGGYNTDTIGAIGRGRLSQLLTLAQFGDYVAYYLALCYGVDPRGNVERGAWTEERSLPRDGAVA